MTTNNCVRAIIKLLQNHKGFDWWWDDVDTDDRAEIEQAMAEIIAQHETPLPTIPSTGQPITQAEIDAAQ